MSRQTDLIARRIAAGLCRDCGHEPAETGKTRGAKCAAKAAERQRTRRGTITPGLRGRKSK